MDPLSFGRNACRGFPKIRVYLFLGGNPYSYKGYSTLGHPPLGKSPYEHTKTDLFLMAGSPALSPKAKADIWDLPVFGFGPANVEAFYLVKVSFPKGPSTPRSGFWGLNTIHIKKSHVAPNGDSDLKS